MFGLKKIASLVAAAMLLVSCSLAGIVQGDDHPIIKAGNVLAYVGYALADFDDAYDGAHKAGTISLAEYTAWKSKSKEYVEYWIAAKRGLIAGDAVVAGGTVNDLRAKLSAELLKSGLPVEQVFVLSLMLREAGTVKLPSVIPPIPADQQEKWSALMKELDGIENRLK